MLLSDAVERCPNVGALAGINRRLHDRLRVQRIVLDGDVPTGGTPKQPLLFINPTEPPSASTAAIKGAIYFDDDLNGLMQYNGSAWEEVGSTVNSKVTVLTSATATPALTDSGTHYILQLAGGIDVTLPAIGASDVGTRFRFTVGLAASSDTYTITAAAGDLLTGRVFVQDTDTANTVTSYAPDGSDDLIITFSDTADLPGSYVDLVATSATSWMVTGIIFHTGNAATPFS